MGGICSCGKSSQVAEPTAGSAPSDQPAGGSRRAQADVDSQEAQQKDRPKGQLDTTGSAVNFEVDDDLFPEGETRARRRAMADKIRSASQRRLEGLGEDEQDKAMELENMMENFGRSGSEESKARKKRGMLSIKKMGSSRSFRPGSSDSSGEDEEDEETTEEEDDGEEDDDIIFPVFDHGPRVKLRSVSRGRKRRQKYDLTSGYQLAKIRRRVQKDMAWTNESNTADHHRKHHDHAAAHPRAPGWKTVVLYLSSTLEEEDTASERGLLWRVTLPELQMRLADRMVNLVVADPRLSVAREPQSAGEGAEVVACLQAAVASGDGFVLVALRGNRYGWTPSAGEIGKEVPAEWPVGQSVQAAEVQCGVRWAPEKGRCLVYYRNDREAAEPDRARLAEECAELTARAREEPALLQVQRYEDLNPHGIDAAKHDAFKDALANQAFCDLVRHDVEAAIEPWLEAWGLPERSLTEVEQRQAQRQAQEKHEAMVAEGQAKFQTNETSYRRPNIREEIARECGQRLVEAQCRDFQPNPKTVHALFNAVREQRQHVYVTGAPGSGKTAVLAWCARRFQALAEEGWVVLAHFAGAGEGWGSVRGMLRRFCGELCRHMRVHAPVKDDLKALNAQFAELVTKATLLYAANVLVVVDGYDQMDATEQLGTQAWIPDNEILGLTVVLSMERSAACHKQVCARAPRHAEVAMHPLEEPQLLALASAKLRRALPGFAEEDLPAALLAATAALGDRSTLWLVTACCVLATIAELYARQPWPASAMRERGEQGKGAGEEAKVLEAGSTVQERLVEMAEGWAEGVVELAEVLDPLVKLLEAELGSDPLRDFVCLLAVDDHGVREGDMLALLGYGEEEVWDGGSDGELEVGSQGRSAADALTRASSEASLSHMRDILEGEEGEEEEEEEEDSVTMSGGSGGSPRRHEAQHGGRGGGAARVATAGADFGIAAAEEEEEGGEEEGEEEGEGAEQGMSFLTFQRIKRCLREMLQPAGETDPGVVRLRDREVRRVLRERFVPDKEVQAVVHHHVADYLCVVAGGEWTEAGGMSFSQQGLALLRRQRHSLMRLPFHLMKAQAWTDCVQLLCDLWFLRGRMELRFTELHIEDTERLGAIIGQERPRWEGSEMEAQLETLAARTAEMARFLRQDKEHLVQMPFITAQQAANQPQGSAPEIEGAAQLTFELPGKVRYGKRSRQALEADKVLLAARRGLARYSPVRTIAAAGELQKVENGSDGGDSMFGMSAVDRLASEAEEESEGAVLERGPSEGSEADGEGPGDGEGDRFQRTKSMKALLTRVGTSLSMAPAEPDFDMTRQHTYEDKPVCWLEVLNKGEIEEHCKEVRHAMAFKQVAISNDEVPRCGEALVCVAGASGCVRVYDTATMEEIYEFSGHSQAVNHCAFDPQLELLATASDDSSLRVWQMPQYDNVNRKITGKGRCTVVLRGSVQGNAEGHQDCVTQCDFTPDGLSLVSASDDTTIKTWNHRSGLVLRTLTGHSGWVSSIRCSPMAAHLLTGADNGVVRLWDISVMPHATDKGGVQLGSLLWERAAHRSPITVVQWSPDGRHMATASEDCVVLVWRRGSKKPIARIEVAAAPQAISFDVEAWRLWTLLEDGVLYVCDIRPAARPLACLPLRPAIGGRSFALLPQAGNTCVCAAGDGTVTRARLHNAVHVEVPPRSPPPAKEAGRIRIADDEDDTEELEWLEFSGPLCVKLERVGGSAGRVSVNYTTYGTNDDDPDFSPIVGIVEWEDGDSEDKEVWVAMKSFNEVEWDAMASVVHVEPSTGEQVRVPAKLAAFGRICHVVGSVARSRPWHPPLAAKADYRQRLDEVRDAEREFMAAGGRRGEEGEVEDDAGAEHARLRVELAEEELGRVQGLGSDADLGLTDWTDIGGKVAVVDLGLYLSVAEKFDPEEALRAFSEAGLEMAKRAQRAGAKGVVLVSCDEEARVPKLKDVDCFDEVTGQWDREALAAAHVEIPVVVVRASEGTAAHMRLGTQCQIVPEASNYRFWQERGVHPKIQLEMKGDTEFEVVLCGPEGTSLDAERARAKVRIVTREEMERRNQRVAESAARVRAEAERRAAEAAEAVASRERREADEAEAAYAAEEREAREAERRLEELTVRSSALQGALEEKMAEVEALDSKVEEREQRAINSRAVVKGMKGLVKQLEEHLREAETERKSAGKAALQRQRAALEQAAGRYESAAQSLAEDVEEIREMTARSDGLWGEVDEMQREADEAMAAVVEQEARYRRERAEADLARLVRDKEVAEAEEAEEQARVEAGRAAEAQQAMAAKEAERAAEEERVRREEEGMRRRVQEAAEAMEEAARREAEEREAAARAELAAAKAEEEKRAAAAAEAEEREAAERDRKKRQQREAQTKWEAMEAEREADLRRRADKVARQERLMAGGGGGEYPWRKTRLDLEAGFSRKGRPKLAQDWHTVMREWEESRGAGQHGAVDRVADVAGHLPAHLRRPALQLASQDYLHALSAWGAVNPAEVLDGQQLKLSGRLPCDEEREQAWPNLAAGEGGEGDAGAQFEGVFGSVASMRPSTAASLRSGSAFSSAFPRELSAGLDSSLPASPLPGPRPARDPAAGSPPPAGVEAQGAAGGEGRGERGSSGDVRGGSGGGGLQGGEGEGAVGGGGSVGSARDTEAGGSRGDEGEGGAGRGDGLGSVAEVLEIEDD